MKPWSVLFLLLAILAFATACATTSAVTMTGNTSPISQLQQFTSADFREAAVEGRAARAAGGLSGKDVWAECFDEVADRLDAMGTLSGDPVDKVGAATLIMRAHIAKNRVAQPMTASCSQVLLDLERDGARIAVGQAAGLVPGGGAALKALHALPTLLRMPGLLGQ